MLLVDLKQILAWLHPSLVPFSTNAGSRCIKASHSTDPKTQNQRCLEHARRLHPLATSIQPLAQQGGCSFTLLVRHNSTNEANNPDNKGDRAIVLQFRPQRFALDLALCHRAHEIYGALIPCTIYRGRMPESQSGREVYELSLVPGIRFDSLQPTHPRLSQSSLDHLKSLLHDLAHFFTTSFHSPPSSPTWRHCPSKIGSSLLPRLTKLSLELPTPALRARAQTTLSAIEAGALDLLPVVLTHGDLLPSNILVDPETWGLTGLVDWAEAEDLPFGIGLYGVEYLLGYLEDGAWVWYEQAFELRALFWDALVDRLPELRGEMEESVRIAKEIGILLWHGFAWDDGRIDRVVDERVDGEELEMLRDFLDVSAGGLTSRDSKRDSKFDLAF